VDDGRRHVGIGHAAIDTGGGSGRVAASWFEMPRKERGSSP